MSKKLTKADLEKQNNELKEQLSELQRDFEDSQKGNLDLHNKLDQLLLDFAKNKVVLNRKSAMLDELENEVKAVSEIKNAEPKVFKACVLNILFGQQLIYNLGVQKMSKIILNSFGENKIRCIKALREASDIILDNGWGLKEAKEISESGPGKVIFDNLSDSQVKLVLDIFQNIGSDAELKVE